MVATAEATNGKRVKKAGKAKAPKPEKPRKPKKITMLDTELEPLKEADSLLKKIERAEADCDSRMVEVDSIREQLKTAKGAYSHAVNVLRKLCRARAEKHPLFDKPAKPADKPADAKTAEAKEGDKPAEAYKVQVTISAGVKEHGMPLGQDVDIWAVKPGGLIVVAPSGSATAIADAEYTATEAVKALVAKARDEKITSDHDKWAAWVASQLAPQASSDAKPAEQVPVIDATTESKPAVDHDAWKTLPLSAAGINGRGGKLLEEAGHDTLGKVAKLMNDHGQWWNKEVKGIGEETASEIADRFADFWANHPEFCQSETVA